ncbi:MAG TPA: hypothetical protein VF543_22250 [Pyrinomonadaceae bacterium]|jgi:ribosomal protein S27AE
MSNRCCENSRRLLISSGRGSGGYENVDVCAECGAINVFSLQDDHQFSTTFRLYSSATLIAASQAYRFIQEGTGDEILSKRVWKPLDFGHLRLYQVTLYYKIKGEIRDRRKYFIVASTAPRYAAEIIEKLYKEDYENNPQIAHWSVKGYALDILQPLEWTKNGCTLLNLELLNTLKGMVEMYDRMAYGYPEKHGDIVVKIPDYQLEAIQKAKELIGLLTPVETRCPDCGSENVMSDTPPRGVCNNCGFAWDNRAEPAD